MSDSDFETTPEEETIAGETEELTDEELEDVAGGWTGEDPGP